MPAPMMLAEMRYSALSTVGSGKRASAASLVSNGPDLAVAVKGGFYFLAAFRCCQREVTAYIAHADRSAFGGKPGLETVHWWVYWAPGRGTRRFSRRSGRSEWDWAGSGQAWVTPEWLTHMRRHDEDPADHRRRVLTLTARGQKQAAEFATAGAEVDDDFFSPLTAAQQQSLRQMLLSLLRASG
jgi:hypothetical protein